MKKLTFLLSASLLAFVATSTFSKNVSADDVLTGSARLHQFKVDEEQSGIKARIEFIETYDGLMIMGHATGLTPGLPFASLLYDSGTKPGGPSACVPTIPGFNMPFIVWNNNGDGTGTLTENLIGRMLTEFGAISIRDLTINPPNNLVACGRVDIDE